ncbi:MAG: threonylcarbamoyl-AMP synthase [Myxococcales bacterium]|nr:threonylcarbamoyl-AMP synthase [Myxococcales bacterium]
MRLSVYAEHPQPRKIAQAVEVLRRGGVIAYPTDTVYGLGCDLQSRKAIDRIYRMKRMKETQPLALLCPDLGEIARFAMVDNVRYRILKRACPGPYCFILPATREVPRLLMTKRRTVGIRVPDSPVVHALLSELGGPMLNTSAALDGEQFQDPADIDRAFPDVDLIVDVGVCGVEPSTVIDLSGDTPVVERQGLGAVEGLL